MQFHHGSRLKDLVNKSGLTVREIIDKSTVSKTTLYNYFEYEDISQGKIKPILDVLGISVEDFYRTKTGIPITGTTSETVRNLHEQVIALQATVAVLVDSVKSLMAAKEKKTYALISAEFDKAVSLTATQLMGALSNGENAGG